ncbi:MAG TPA: SDR family oxidoreductase [Flavobacterium sp.]|jgi:3-oxoacyl-[acyl-carrier protein] reductase
MISKFYRRFKRYSKNFISYIRAGGVVHVTVAQLNYPELLKDKKVLITGGTSGIGYAIAAKFLSQGAKVVITGRSEINLQNATQKLASEALFSYVWDVNDFTDIESKIRDVSSLLGGIDILINNAGILIDSSFQDVNEDIWDKTVSANLKSVFFISQKCCDYFMAMNPNRISKIINISSMSGIISAASPYYISKAGINTLTKGLAKEHTRNGIIVNAIAPGVTNTNMNNFNDNLFRDQDNKNGRVALPEEIAELALFLASDASNNIVGQIISIDGGESLL